MLIRPPGQVPPVNSPIGPSQGGPFLPPQGTPQGMWQRPPMGLMQPPVQPGQPPVMQPPVMNMPPATPQQRGMPFEGNMPGPGKFGPQLPVIPMPPQQQVANALAQQRMGRMRMMPNRSAIA